MKVSLIILLCFLCSCYGLKTYHGVKLIQATPQTSDHLQWLKDFYKNNFKDVDFWKGITTVGRPADMQISHETSKLFLRQASERNLPHKIVINDLQKLIDEQQRNRMNRRERRSNGDFDLTIYHPLQEIYDYLDSLASSYDDVEFSKIGSTLYKRDVKKFYIGSEKNPIIAFDCGIHAREWISVASCLYMINQLLTNSSYSDMKNNYDWFFIPVTNPDGYDRTWTEDRMWRKNMEHYDNKTECMGTDLNRNYDADFAGEGSSHDLCSETYHGPDAFSDPETAAHRDQLVPLKGKILAHFSMHSYGQKWMGPFGYKAAYPEETDDIMHAADEGVKALTSLYGTEYEIGSSYHAIYQTSGGGRDWAYETLGAVYSYVMELRDQGMFGFLLPEEEILPTAKETWTGITTAVKVMENNQLKV